MAPKFMNGNVQATCPTCAAVTTFEYREGNQREYGNVVIADKHTFNDVGFGHIFYQLQRCAGCGRGGMAMIHVNSNGYQKGTLEAFWPSTISRLSLPSAVPDDIKKEFQEAELCASVSAWRAGSALLRSVLEKTLKANGYTAGNLADRIDQAATDGVITAARSRRAHDEIRVLGNDILHDAWRKVGEEEYEDAHRYSQRILEDLYDDREAVEKLLNSCGRLQAP